MGREAKVHNGLTRKQTIFVSEILNGGSATQAALAAYKTTDPAVAKVIASQNLSKLNVKTAIEEALSSKGVSVDELVANIGKIASSEPEKITAEAKLKANIELLKLMGAYPNNTNKGTDVSFKARINRMTYDEARNEFAELEIATSEFIVDAELS